MLKGTKAETITYKYYVLGFNGKDFISYEELDTIEAVEELLKKLNWSEQQDIAIIRRIYIQTQVIYECIEKLLDEGSKDFFVNRINIKNDKRLGLEPFGRFFESFLGTLD